MKALICVLFTVLLQISECARKAMEGFVVGGYESNILDNPHSVFISAKCGKQWICGAAILNQQVILTAAHCLYSCEIRRNHRIDVSAGSGNLKSINIKRTVKRLVVHQNYAEVQVWNDIGIGLLDQRIPLTRYTKRVIIQRLFPLQSPYAKVAGWGTVDEDTQASSFLLRQVPQRLRSIVTCAKVGHLIPGMFCAGSENFYADHPAAGDSGGALIIKEHTAIGLVSFRVPQYPALSVYTNISFYFDWLTRNSANLFCYGK